MFVRYYVLYRLPNLNFLDSRPVKSKEKEEAQRVGAHMKIVAPSSEEMVSEDLQWSKECVHDGHVGGWKQYNDFPLGNIFYFYANIFYCFSPPTWPPYTHSIAFMEQFQNTRLTCNCTNLLASVMLLQIRTIYKGPDF